MTLRLPETASPNEDTQGKPLGQKEFRGDIEGLRAVAVLAVVLFHAEVPGLGGGYIGVDVFFVISGFLITGLLWREMSTSGTVGLRGFYGARARRLLPASALVGVVTAIASVILLPPLLARTVIGDGIASALYVGNYRFVQQGVDYLAEYLPPSPYLHYWSLGVEEQFYLVWPALILGTGWVVRRVRRRNGNRATASVVPYIAVLALVTVVSFAMSLSVTSLAPSVAFFSLPTRAWELAVGGLVALTIGTWRHLPAVPAAITGWTGLAMIVLACTLFTATTPFPGTAALLPVLGTAMVIGAGCASPARGCGRLLSVAPMRAIGRVSYSWYLWHWPVLLLAPPLLGHQLGLAGRLTAALVSAVLAVLTLYLIENPLRFAAPIRQSAVRSLALGAAATALAVCVGAALLVSIPTPVGRGAPADALKITAASVPRGDNVDAYEVAVQQTFAQVQAAVAASEGLRAVPSNLDPPLVDAAAELPTLFPTGCMRTYFEVEHPECARGDVTSTTRVALIGDSFAAMWAPALQQIAEQRQWRLELLTKAGCPMMNLPVYNVYLHRKYTECEQWRDQIMSRLRAERPQLIVMSMWRAYEDDWGFTSYDPAWISSLTKLVRQLHGTGAKVLVLGAIPDPGTVVPICLSGHLDDASACSPPRSTAVSQSGITDEATATRAGGGAYADLTELFCTAERCPVIVGNTLVYLDAWHLAPGYSRALAPAIGALVDRALANG